MIYGDKPIDGNLDNEDWMDEAERIARDEVLDDPIGVLNWALEASTFYRVWADVIRAAFTSREFHGLGSALRAAQARLAEEIYQEFADGKRGPVWEER